MGRPLGRVALGGLSLLAACARAGVAAAQNAEFPADPPPPTPAPPAAAPEPSPAAPPAPAAAPAEPADAVPVPVAPPNPASTQPYATDGGAPRSAYGEPPPPPAPPQRTSPIPPFSARLDPLNWILVGRLGLELEVGVLKWMTVETVPIFITDGTPPLLDYSRYDVDIEQHSGGWGPLAGASLGVNFWLSGKPLKGYMLGVGLTNYSLEYESKNADESRADFVSHTERQLYFLFGSIERIGAFSIGGGIGFGYDLNNETRCLPDGLASSQPSPGDCDAIQLKVPDPSNPNTRVLPFDVTPFIYPWDILARFSLGVSID